MSLKFGACYLHHGSVGRVQSKECYFMFAYMFCFAFSCFLLFFFLFVFHQKNVFFLSFSFIYLFFCRSIKYPQQKKNQSETGIGGKKLSVKLYIKYLQKVTDFCPLLKI